jgi:hypothetical protein
MTLRIKIEILVVNFVILSVIMLSIVTPSPVFVSKFDLSNSLWAHLSLNYYEHSKILPPKSLITLSPDLIFF